MAIECINDAYLTLLSEFEPVEIAAVREAKALLKSAGFESLRRAFQNGRSEEVQVGNWTIVYENSLPDPFCGMTLFDEQAFVLGNAAMRTEAELQKTVLQEFYRLCARQSASGMVGAQIAAQTTKAAEFVTKAWPVLVWLV